MSPWQDVSEMGPVDLQVGMNTMMHLTCTNMSVEKLKDSLEQVRLIFLCVGWGGGGGGPGGGWGGIGPF